MILYEEGGIEISRTTTAISEGMAGSYLFEDILAGNYYLHFEVEEVLIATEANVGNDDTQMS